MAITRVIRVRASRKEVLRVLRKLPAIAAGKASGHGGMAQALLVRIGMAALGRIKTAFVEKAAGGTDETGLRWAPLSPHTIAYDRRHPDPRRRNKNILFPGKKRAEYAPSWMLTPAQRRRWWQLYRQFGGSAPQGKAFHARGSQSQGHAAAMAWVILKSEGAQTIIGTFGSARVLILRDTGLLLNSLSPGVVIGTGPAPQRPTKVKNQVFRLGQGEVIIGTNRKWAGTHHRGMPGRLPERRLWPDPKTWTPGWWSELTEQAALGLIDIVTFLLTRRRT